MWRCLDELHLEHPFYGSRQMARHLRREGVVAGRHRVRRLMRLMGMEAVYRKPRTSVAHPEHRVYPYLLRDLAIDRPDQVWCADITYIPVARGFFYLVPVMDWASRHVLSWRLSNTMDSAFCIDALEAALRCGTPEIFNTDSENVCAGPRGGLTHAAIGTYRLVGPTAPGWLDPNTDCPKCHSLDSSATWGQPVEVPASTDIVT